jgi:hypothetical protein
MYITENNEEWSDLVYANLRLIGGALETLSNSVVVNVDVFLEKKKE